MLALLLTTVLSYTGAPAQDEELPPPPTAEEVAEEIAELKKVLAGKEDEGKVERILESAEVPHGDVVDVIEPLLRDRDPELRKAAIEALRLMRHEDALDALHSLWRKDKSLKKDAELEAGVLKAIGQHASPSSLQLLADKPFATKNNQAVKARILGLGNIQDPRSVETLFGWMKKIERKRVEPQMQHFRISLVRLTGTDQGLSSERWLEWWSRNKKTFELRPKPYALPEEMRLQWDSFWGNRRTYERRTRREDRGKGV